MNKKIVNGLIRLNNSFYSSLGSEFDSRNSHYREGWGRVNFLNYSEILDIGAGNYRLFSYLTSIVFPGRYTAVENLDIFVKKYQKEYSKNFALYNIDALFDLGKIQKCFDLITCFGFIHHIPSTRLRIKWFKEVHNLLKNGGSFVFTTWNFNTLPTFNRAKTELNNVFKEKNLEKGDYFIGWDNKNVFRYCHLYSLSEVKHLLYSSGFNLVSSYVADGKNQVSNTYFIAKKKQAC